MRKFREYKEQIIISLVFFSLALLFNRYLIASDARLYYSVLEEVLFPRLNPHPLPFMKIDSGGYQQFGVAFFWLPFYLISAFLARLPVFNFTPIAIIGKGFLYITTIFVHLAGNFYVLLSLFLCLRILKLYNLRGNKIFVILAVFLSTPLFVYGIPFAKFNHAVDTLALTLFVYLYLIWKDKKAYFQFFIGVLLAVSVFVRYLNISIFVFLLLFYIWNKDMRRAKFILFGFLSLIWILPVSFYLINGSSFKPLVSTLNANSDMPFVIFNLIPKYALKLLSHPIHGLFIWSPITILSFYGLIQYYQEDKRTALFFIGIFLSLLLSQGCFYNWHAGWSFSQRYLTGMFPVFVFGFAFYLYKYPKSGLIFGSVFTIYTLFLLLNWGTVIHGELGTPIDMIQAWALKENRLDLIVTKLKGLYPALQ